MEDPATKLAGAARLPAGPGGPALRRSQTGGAGARRLRAQKQTIEEAAYAACFNVSAFFAASSIVPTM